MVMKKFVPLKTMETYSFPKANLFEASKMGTEFNIYRYFFLHQITFGDFCNKVVDLGIRKKSTCPLFAIPILTKFCGGKITLQLPLSKTIEASVCTLFNFILIYNICLGKSQVNKHSI